MSNSSFGNDKVSKVFKVFKVLNVLIVSALLSCGGGDDAVVEEAHEYDGPLKGVTFAVMGNSISSYKGTQPQGYYYNYTPDKLPVDSMWWALLEKKTGAEMIANSSWSGATVSFRTDKENVDTISYFYSDNRVNSIGRNGTPEAVFVLGGTNDWSISQTLGSVASGFDINTFYGAYSLMADKITRRYPYTRLYLCSILPRKQQRDKPNSAGWTQHQGNQVIQEIAEKYYAVYVDLEQCGLDRNLSLYTSDGVHPTAKGMALIAEEIMRKVKSEK